MKTYIGIDNGVTGAFAVLRPDDSWTYEPVKVIDCGRGKLLDVDGNLAFLDQMAQCAGGTEQLVVACEEPPINPRFGAKGNFANGRNGEFWRVLLALKGFSFAWVSSRIWQRDVLRGILGRDTKKMAKLFISQRFPAVTLNGGFTAPQKEAIRDAMCIALWARTNSR